MLLWIALAHGDPLTVDTLGAGPAPDERPVPIVGGFPSSSGDWPSLVALHTDVGFACSGVQIDAEWVLTAGHCSLGLHRVQVGAIDAGDPEDGVWVEISEVFVHEAFLDTYDVAAVRLVEAVDGPVIPLALDCEAEHALQDGEATILVGYGATDTLGHDMDRWLHEGHSWLVDHDCDELERGCNTAVSPGGEFIAGGEGVDTCTGDSGGPAFMAWGDELRLVGITSRAALPAQVTCGDGGIFVRSDAISGWLASLGVPLIYPDCEGANRAPRPSSVSLEVQAGDSVRIDIDPDDPNAGDHHTLALTHPPSMGRVRTSPSGNLRYHAPEDAIGPTSFGLVVTDDGVPPLTGSVWVGVTVTEPTPTGSGCLNGTRAWLFLFPWIVWGRRKS